MVKKVVIKILFWFRMAILIKRKRYVSAQSANYGSTKATSRRDYRVGLILVFFILFLATMVVRLFKLQVLEHNYYVALASDQHEIFKQLYPVRGTIYVADKEKKAEVLGYPIAVNRNMNLLYAVPKSIKDPEAVLEVLKEVFNLKESAEAVVPATILPEQKNEIAPLVETSIVMTEEEKVLLAEKDADQKIVDTWRGKLAKKDDPYEALKHLVSDTERDKVKSYNLEGIQSSKEVTRYYPEQAFGSQLLGFVGKQSQNNILKGYYGIEGCYDKELAGETGFLRSELDNFGRWIATAGQDFRKAKDGNNIVLTIDKSIEYFACDELAKAVAKHGAENGSLVVMDVSTGAILAMCNSPEFDPNKYNEVTNMRVFGNRAISESYEPGSVMKAITLASAIDGGKVDPFSTYVDTGELRISGYTIKNSDLRAHGLQTMTQVLEKSLNTGAAFAAKKLGLADFKKYIEGFGFGKKTEIDLCSEVAGNVKSLNDKNEIYLATASFGQGITATPIQLARAYGAIANEGKLMAPYVIDKIVDHDGNVIKETKPRVMSQIISPNTAKLVSSMLVSVVKNGHAKNAAIPGYMVAAKTGTAQMPDLVHGGYSEKTIHTFIGYAPFNKPKFVMLTKLTDPKDAKFAESTALPLWRTVAKFILDYYEVPTEVK